MNDGRLERGKEWWKGDDHGFVVGLAYVLEYG
jgi:hypothetical protein